MIFDPMYFVFIGPPMLLALWAQWKVKSSFAKYSEIRSSSGITGAEAADLMLREAGIRGVRIEQVGGTLSDHYDPKAKIVRLSPDVYGGRSIAAMAVACHEVGHAIQDAKGYAPLVIRNAAVPLAGFGSGLGVWMFFIGMILMGMGMVFGKMLAWAGVLFFAVVVVFQIVNLPVEFNASSRAKQYLGTMGLVRPGAEAAGVAAMLSAAAMTYVAGTAQAIGQLLYFVYVLAGRR
ncbi:MAG: zinc metallopeptidase [Candidatus Sumerlaeia bacterium]|nr:zinc metallopeptidase [Candidatus Sumerlaeia bacterium]